MKKLFVAAIACVMAFMLAACGNGSKSDKKETDAPANKGALIGVSMPVPELQRWSQDGDSIKAQLEAKGYTVDLQYGTGNVEKQISQIEDMISEGCKVLVITAEDGDSLGEVLAKAKKAEIPVIAYDRLIMDSDAVDYYVTFDNQAVGVAQGQFIEEALGLKNAQGKTFNIEFATGDLGDNNINYYFEGAMSVLQPYLDAGTLVCPSGQVATLKDGGSYDKTAIATADWDTAKAQARFEGILNDYYAGGQQLDAVLSSNDSVAYGVENALASLYAGTYPVITGQDCDIVNVKNIIGGKQAMSVFKDTRALATRAVEAVDALMTNGKPAVDDGAAYNNGVKSVPSCLCAIDVCTAENYQKLLIDSGYYTKDQLK